MCIAFVKLDHPEYHALIAGNRDEYYARPFTGFQKKGDSLYPIDQKSGGSWIGLGPEGRWALITNVRRWVVDPNAPSRGSIVPDYLSTGNAPDSSVSQNFNLLAGQKSKGYLVHSSESAFEKKITDAEITVSNGDDVNFGWPKEETLARLLKPVFTKQKPDPEQVFSALSDQTRHQFSASKMTGFPDEIEHQLTSVFVKLDNGEYGTVHQTFIAIPKKGKTLVWERFDGHTICHEWN